MVDVAFVKFVIPCAVKDGLVERLAGPFHTSRLDVDVTGQHNNVSVCCGWCKRGELDVQI